MFKAKTWKIANLASTYQNRINELEKIFDKTTNVYIDFGNVVYWQDKLGWHFGLKRLKQFLDSFSTINEVKFYSGKLDIDPKSLQIIQQARKCRYIVKTKPVKIMRLPIDVSSIPLTSPEILKQFIRGTLLSKLNIETIKYLNHRLKDLNQQGIMYLEDRKCNFDVEIGSDILIDHKMGNIDNFVLWSGDSDFVHPVSKLLNESKKVVLFATVRKVSTELAELRRRGLIIFDIQKIKDFICWKKEI